MSRAGTINTVYYKTYYVKTMINRRIWKKKQKKFQAEITGTAYTIDPRF